MQLTEMSADFVCDHFLNYVFANKANARHVRRVTAWIGMLALAIERRCDEWKFNRERQLTYREGDQWYKVRYQHKLMRGGRVVGGIEILKWNGGTYDGAVIHRFTTLAEVEDFYEQTLFRREAA